MVEITYLNDNMEVEVVYVTIIEKADVRPPYDTHIRTVETYGGWWELWNVNGDVCGYFEEEW